MQFSATREIHCTREIVERSILRLASVNSLPVGCLFLLPREIYSATFSLEKSDE